MSATPDSSPEPRPDDGPEERPAPRRPGFGSWPRWGRWTVYAAGVLVLVLLAGLAAGVTVVRRPFPMVEGELEVPGLGARVDVLRDDHGIPQVYADTAEDLFYAQGFVHAQDRFFEMDFRRHVTSGRLSELLGRDALDTDMYIRTMGWRRVAEQELSLLSPETLDYLEAYSAGVNAYIDSHSPAEMALEYSVLALNGLDYAPEEWTPADSVAWMKAMAWDLRGNMQEEIDRAIMSAGLTDDEIATLYPAYPYDRHRPIVRQGAVVDRVFEQDATEGDTRLPTRPAPRAAVAALKRLDRALGGLPQLIGSGQGVGSNSWVVSGERSATGRPILANDPHLGISVPGIWHQMGLHCREVTEACPFDVAGFTFSGLPGVVIGHNQEIAWGFTNLGPDVVDLYLEKVEGESYRYAGGRRRLELRQETIEIAGEDEPVTFTVRSTRHGPLLSDVSTQLSTVGANAHVEREAPARGNGYAVALAWTALSPSRTADALFQFGQARDWTEFREAARLFAAPSQNLVYADREGHIGYQAPGLIPIRKAGHTGAYPVAGWDPANDWTGSYIPFDALPSLLDPEEDMVVTANQAVVDPDVYPYFLGDSWSYGYRSERIRRLLERKEKLTVEDMATIQLDAHNGFAPTFVPYLLDVFMPSQYLAAGQRLLDGWDFHQRADSPAAAYYNSVWRQTLALTFHDQLPASVWPDGGDRWFEVMRRLLAEPDSSWWDDVETETVVETRDEILFEAMSAARDEMVRLQARRAVEWEWGHHHRMNLEHQSVGQSDIGVVRWLFNRGGYQVGGGDSIVNATGWTAPNGYVVDWAPSMRMVVSLEDLDDSRWVNLTGVSGHPFHPHYVDQTDLWVEGRTLPWRFSEAAVEDATEDRLTLVPAPSG